jgi:RND superfamily putative drug exporter
VTWSYSAGRRKEPELSPAASVCATCESPRHCGCHVGGVTATNIDSAHVLTDKLPIFIAIVVFLAFLLLMAVFRSLLIPLVASVMNLLSVAAALGAVNAVFSWGWGSSTTRCT